LEPRDGLTGVEDGMEGGMEPRDGLTGVDYGIEGGLEVKVGLNHDTTRQLDKYNLEIRPQGAFTSSAPFIMPPLDISP
ncbi:unnamed protein product, partial [Adineta steineri]